MILTCTDCHLEMVETHNQVLVVIMDRPRDVLIPVQEYSSRIFDCPGCGHRVTVSLDLENVQVYPGYPVSVILHTYQGDPSKWIVYNYKTAEAMREGLKLGFRDQYGKTLPPLGAAPPPEGPPKLKTE